MRLALLTLAIVWPFLAAAPAPAQAPDLQSAYRRYEALSAAGRYAEAEPFARQALALAEAEFGPNHQATAALVSNLAGLFWAQGRYAEAEPLFKRALAIEEATRGPGHPKVGTALNNLAALYLAQGRYAQAEPLYGRAFDILERALGPEHPSVASTLNNLAALYEAQGRYEDAETLYDHALRIAEQALGPEDPQVATALKNVASLYQAQGRYEEAEARLKRALRIEEAALGPRHPDVATALNNLAALYDSQGRADESEQLHTRALAIREAALGPAHPEVAQSLSNLAQLYVAQGRFDEAEPLHLRALAIREAAFGPDHPEVATALNNLAVLYEAEGRLAEAEPLTGRALAIAETALGPDHAVVGRLLGNLASLYEAEGRLDEAEPLFKYAATIAERALGPEHPGLAAALESLAALYRAQGRHALQLETIRRASAIHRARAARGGERSAARLSEQRKVRSVFLRHLQASLEAPAAPGATRDALIAEGFEAGQLANATGAGAALSRMAARFAAGDDALAGLVRERQDAAERWRRLDESLVRAAARPPGQRDPDGEAALRAEQAAVDRRIAAIDTRLAADFPQFVALSSPRPLPLAEAQALLAEDEALLTYLVWEDESYVFVLRRDRALAATTGLGAQALDQAVAALRRGLDPTDVATLDDIPDFDTETAYALYRALLQPLEPVLAGARHLFVVPDGALQSLPFSVLVTAAGEGGAWDFSAYRSTDWLVRRYALTTLPAVASLKALRGFARRARAERPFLGVGDPQLEGEQGASRGLRTAGLFTSRGLADVDSLRQLAALPESAGELESLARTLGAGEEALILGAEATETRIKHARLADRRVLAFATHGLVAGDLTGLAEPALVLTPPAKASAEDDGLLTASEVAQLRLDADWVILSACNTAAPDGSPGAEGLSGLARAFFYAGSRALLVSHWPVASEAAVKITTRMLREAAKPGVGRAEAHRRAMLALIADRDRPYYAHPLFWAPFVVVGEGGLAEPG